MLILIISGFGRNTSPKEAVYRIGKASFCEDACGGYVAGVHPIAYGMDAIVFEAAEHFAESKNPNGLNQWPLGFVA